MVKVITRIMRHAEHFHYSPRFDIGKHREGNQGLKSKNLERIADDLSRTFGC